jgi:hypothetical protein
VRHQSRHRPNQAPSGSLWPRLLGALVALVLVAGGALPGGRPAHATAGTSFRLARAANLGADVYATGTPMPRYLRGPDAWVWRATLPGTRVILYYGIVGAPMAGVIGWYGGNEGGLLNQLSGQAQAYAQADPSHHVMMGLDVVNPGADGAPTPNGLYVDRLDPGTLQHYLDLTRQNHMLLFMDMQVAFSNVQRELAYLWPYLQYPWVNIALDPEWDHAFHGQGDGCQGYVDNIQYTGRMRASEINYAIDQLSALVVTHHLPPKILLVHQYQMAENPAYVSPICNNALSSEGWQHIEYNKPGVQVVINTDGVGSSLYGGYGLKIQLYNLFHSTEHPTYQGIKMYYYYAGLGVNFYDSPLMTPQQVVGLVPSPSIIMYQ